MKNRRTMFLSIFVITVVAVGCMAKRAVPLPPVTIADNEQFYKDEGSHFEVFYEQWIVNGILETKDGSKLSFASLFNRVGSQFLHVRNGYNYLRLPDGRYDYRSFGQGAIRELTAGLLRKKIEKYPGVKAFARTLELLQADKSEHFQTMPDGSYPLYRGRLFMNYNGNRFERVSDKKLSYELELKTWNGLLKLELEGLTDPLVFNVKRPMFVSMDPNSISGSSGVMQGYAFPRLRVSGVLEQEDRTTALKGTVSFEHWWGFPDGRAMAQLITVFQRLDNGGAFFLAEFFDADGNLKNSHLLIQEPDGKLTRDKKFTIEPAADWRSPRSFVIYNEAWDFKSDAFSGKIEVEHGAQDSELMLDNGVGAFLMAPCNFQGKVPKKTFGGGIRGEGFCRVASLKGKPPEADGVK